jgi:PAS domain S-box-containing protein
MLTLPVFRYGLALVGVALAMGWRLALDSWVGSGLPPYITFYPLVMVVAIFAGFGPGVLATVASGLIVNYWIIPPIGQFQIGLKIDQVGWAIFIVMGISLSIFAELYRRNQIKAVAYANELKLRLSQEQRHRVLVDEAPDGIFFANSQGRYLDVNASGCKMLGYSREELLSLTIADIIDPEELPHLDFQLSLLAQGDSVVSEWQFLRKDGSTFIGEVRGKILENGGYLGFLSDISQRKIFDLAIAQSEEQYRSVVQDQTEVIIRMSTDGNVTFANVVFCQVFGKKLSEIIGQNWRPVVYPEDIPIIAAKLQLISFNNPVVEIENRVYSSSGELIWMHFVNRGIFDINKQLTEIQAVGRDITRRKVTEAALSKSEEKLQLLVSTQANRLLALAESLTNAEQRERDNLSELLHGDVQPILVAARLALNGISEHTSKEKALFLRNSANEHISHSLDAIRNLSRKLSPPLIRNQGLFPALQSLFVWLNENLSLKVEFVCTADIEPDALSLRYLIFNSVKELLMNVVKHSATNQAKVMFVQPNISNFQITVADQGQGFDTNSLAIGHGLSTILQRFDMIGGKLIITSNLNKGTMVTMLVPNLNPSLSNTKILQNQPTTGLRDE